MTEVIRDSGCTMEPLDGSVEIHCKLAAKLNFACQQSSFAPLRELQIENVDGQACLEDVFVKLSSNPSFLKPKSWRLDQIAPGGRVSVRDRDIELDGEFFLDLADAMHGSATVSVEHGGRKIAESSQSIELLAYNEWGGAGYMPELLAAFCMPNDPSVDRILHSASEILRQAGKSDGIDGYQSGSRQRIWEIVSAIYSAVCNLRISYAVPPASFESDGQKIRLPGQILENRVATCLDTSMLFASALEQAGLNPIVAMPKEHAMAGVWLQPEQLSTIVIDNAEPLRKCIQLRELVLIETTFTTSRTPPPFSKATEAASDRILPDLDDSFVSAVDIKRARAHRIMPLARKLTVSSEVAKQEAEVEVGMEEAPALPDFDLDENESDTPTSPEDRLERWQRKLLDLTARNKLLNYKDSSTSLRLICPDPAALEDKLAAGAKIRIKPAPSLSVDQQDEEVHLERTGELISQEYAREALEQNQLLVNLPKNDLDVRAVKVYRKAISSLREGGSNTLYLAIGFLLWRCNENDKKRFRAPLILLPVTLNRKSVRSGIRMVANDDEPRFNSTLLEMLRRDFKLPFPDLEGPLPTDDSGIDVSRIWNSVRKAVKDVPGFEVVEDVVLGHFSFAKYLMWKDLVDRTDELRKNAVVKHLIDSPRDAYPSNVEFVEGRSLDRLYKPSDLLTPLPADASQMSAIATADEGKDFILIGPPGTGKSQTISNMIAHILGKGKTVLFVSEKTAALEVVYRRLKKNGLGNFCLELHSNKAQKTDVLKQLGSAWQVAMNARAEGITAQSQALEKLRSQLDRVVQHLHMPRKNGLTAYYAIGIKVRDEKLASRLTFSWPSANQHSKEQLVEMRETADHLRIQAKAIGDISSNALQPITKNDWSPQWETRLTKAAGRLSARAQEAEQAVDSFLSGIGISVECRSLGRLDSIVRLAEVLMEAWKKQGEYALKPNGNQKIEALDEAIKRLKDYAALQASLSCSYEPFAWRTLDGSDIEHRLKDAQVSWWLSRFFKRRRLLKEIQTNGAKGKPDPAHDAPILRQLREQGMAIDKLDKQLNELHAWHGHTSDIELVRKLQSLGTRIRQATSALADNPSNLIEIRGNLRTLMEDGNDLLAPESAVGQAATRLITVCKNLNTDSRTFEAMAGRAVTAGLEESSDVLHDIRITADAIATHHAELHEWCNWQRRRSEAMALELEPLVKAIENGLVPLDEIPATFEAAYCTWWSAAIIGEDDVLRKFSTPEQMATIEQFQEAQAAFQKLTAEYIVAKLSRDLPDVNDVKRSSSWGILRHELQKKRRHKPVRELIEEIPNVMTMLAPCLMMSPLSVAQYLPANRELFDVVIFDEASQITPWDAVGALARGKQVIIAGDPKQMPPTNFFNRSTNSEDDGEDSEEDLESILNEMSAASIPEKSLNLHYRSRKESLIAFSNARYYGNSLITFPAPIYPDDGIRLVRPDGFYARGGARHNQGEAETVVKEVLRRLNSESPEIRSASIGVVTINSQQQNLIEDLLDKARSSHPHLEWAFSSDSTPELVFVKNLETVQGDERDVILLSVTYGPDQSGHVSMNFGPLNRPGGERRLNVALTRARSEIVVFSTLSPDMVDLSRTKATAVKDLKHFLEYAERGPSALAEATYGSQGDFESPFEAAVARALRERGWKVHPQVGVSAYRIDLGVVHPELPGRYLAGIECDGAMYHSSAFAQERDKIRESVLNGLGWKLFRIWSTDWWTNAPKALEVVHASLTRFLEADRAKRSQEEKSRNDAPQLI